MGSEIITTPGAGSFDVPAGVTSITVKLWAGGGGGIGRTTNGVGGGGGGGAYSEDTVSVTPGGSVPYVVGAGGASSTAGGDTSWNSGEVLAKGGASAANNTNAGQSGGLASAGVGAIKYNGGNGGNSSGGSGASDTAGGGGESAGPTGAGNSAVGNTAGTGLADAGDGGRGAFITTDQDGFPGTAPGGGGGGGKRRISGTRLGGAGADGRIEILWDDPPAGPSITDVTPDAFVSGDTGIVITGSFSASGNTVELGDNATYASANKQTQTITAEDADEITFTGALGSLTEGALYLFVTDADDNVSEGFPVTVTAPVGGSSPSRLSLLGAG